MDMAGAGVLPDGDARVGAAANERGEEEVDGGAGKTAPRWDVLHDEMQMQSELARCALMWWCEGKDARGALHELTEADAGSAWDRANAAVALLSPHMAVAGGASPCTKSKA
jgi:hypothetical protein